MSATCEESIEGRESGVAVVRVVVASTSAAKVGAVRAAFAAALGADTRVETVAVAVPSGVRAQPVGAAETLCGACHRLRAAAARVPGAAYYVAIEGGVAPPPACALLAPHPAALSAIAFAAVARRDPSSTTSSSTEGVLRVSVVPAPAFPLPRALCDRVVAHGEELGVACGRVFAGHDGKDGAGAVGCLTAGRVPRTQLYAPAVHLALVPFLNPTLAFDLPILALAP